MNDLNLRAPLSGQFVERPRQELFCNEFVPPADDHHKAASGSRPSPGDLIHDYKVWRGLFAATIRRRRSDPIKSVLLESGGFAGIKAIPKACNDAFGCRKNEIGSPGRVDLAS